MMMRKAPGKKVNADGCEAQKRRDVCKGDNRAEVMAVEDVPISPELDRRIRQRGRDLRLRQVDRKHAAKLVNDLKKNFLEFLKNNKEQPFFRNPSVLNAGSYYELVKVDKPNKFEIMLTFKTPRLEWKELEDYNGLFYTVSLCRPTRHEIRSFLLEDERTISSNKIMKAVHHLVQKFVSNYQESAGECHWVMCKKQINSPAVTLAYINKDDGAEIISVGIVPALEVAQGWPEAAQDGLDVDKWLGKINRRRFLAKPFYFVAKRPKQRNLNDVERESWSISFSHVEKEIILRHGNMKTCCEGRENECCRKLCLRLLKCLFENLKQTYPKELDRLCSYHGKTAFFHHLSARCEDSLWTPGQLSNCFMKLLEDFEHATQIGSLPHFFIPNHNLFSPSAFPKCSLMFLTNALKNQRESGLPLLQVQYPTPALCYTPTLSPQLEETIAETVPPQTARKSSLFTSAYMTMACIVVFLAIGCTYMIFTFSVLL